MGRSVLRRSQPAAHAAGLRSGCDLGLRRLARSSERCVGRRPRAAARGATDPHGPRRRTGARPTLARSHRDRNAAMNASADTSNHDPAEIARFDATAQRWWDPHGEFKALHALNPVRLAYVDERAGLRGKRVLDVGCGGGLLSEAMARAGATVTGIDLAPLTIEVAELHALDSGLPVRYVRQAAEMHALEHAGEYDVITCMEMLEHVPDPAGVLRALHTLVKPGGRVFLSTLNRTLKAYLFAVVGA